MEPLSVEPGTIELSSSAPEWQQVVLVPHLRVTKAGRSPAEMPDELQGWLKLGLPLIQPVKTAGGFSFDIVQITLSLRPKEDEPLEHVWLKVVLESEPEDPALKAIAWSMLPQKASTEVEVGSKLSFDAGLKISVVELKAGHETETKYARDDVFLEAFNELRNDPLWEFSATPAVAIRGSHRLVMVVRRGQTVPCRGTVSLSATVQRKHWGLIPYDASLGSLDKSMFMIED